MKELWGRREEEKGREEEEEEGAGAQNKDGESEETGENTRVE